MKNLKLFIVFLIVLGFNTSYAQLQKGNLLIGGGASFNLQFNDGTDNSFSFALSPNVLGLVTDNIAVGGSIGLSYSKFASVSNTSISFQPKGRIYFPSNEHMAFYFDAGIGLQFLNLDINGGTDSETALVYSFGPGIAYFISEDVSIDTGLAFNRLGGFYDQSFINLRVGIQVFLNRQKEE